MVQYVYLAVTRDPSKNSLLAIFNNAKEAVKYIEKVDSKYGQVIETPVYTFMEEVGVDMLIRSALLL